MTKETAQRIYSLLQTEEFKAFLGEWSAEKDDAYRKHLLVKIDDPSYERRSVFIKGIMVGLDKVLAILDQAKELSSMEDK